MDNLSLTHTLRLALLLLVRCAAKDIRGSAVLRDDDVVHFCVTGRQLSRHAVVDNRRHKLRLAFLLLLSACKIRRLPLGKLAGCACFGRQEFNVGLFSGNEPFERVLLDFRGVACSVRLDCCVVLLVA